MKLRKLTRLGSTKILLLWDDGHEGPVALGTLRGACPCAGCQGETVLLHHYAPVSRAPATAETYELKGVELIGNYALKPSWGDGHDQGIYTWEQLRALCECDDCASRKTGEHADD
jgi:DUF971 family protein